MICPICGDKTKYPIMAAIEHFYLWQPEMTQYWRGNVSMFGFVRGTISTAYLICPALNTIRFWKYRKHRLEINQS